MCNVLNDIEKKNIDLFIRYYGLEDLITGWEIKAIIDNKEFFAAFYANYPISSLETMNDYIVYLFSLKFCALSETISLLSQDEHKEVIATLSREANAVCETIGKGAVIKFINTHIEEIFAFSDQTNDVRYMTLELIKQYVSGIKAEVYAYLCSNYYWSIIGNFDSFYKVIKSNPSLFEVLYPSGHLADLQKRQLKDSLDIFSVILEGNNETLKALVNDRVSVLCADVEMLVASIMENNVMLHESVVRELTDFLRRIKHPKANDFGVHYKVVEEILYKSIEKNGKKSEYEIPVGKIIEQFCSTENWVARLLSLTHRCDSNSSSLTFKSRLSFSKDETNHIVDFCSTNIPTDSYFTCSHQNMLEIYASVGTGTMLGVMDRSEVFQDYAKLVMSALHFISEQMKREDAQLFEDWSLLDRMLQIIMVNRDLDEKSIQPLCYSAAMFICSFTEKILRLYYIDKVKNDTYVSVENATLGRLLTEMNSKVVEIFDPIHTRHLEFFMSKNGDKKIGHDYRNRLAHWAEMKSSMLTIPFVAKLLWLFTDVLNTIFWYYIKDAEETISSDK